MRVMMHHQPYGHWENPAPDLTRLILAPVFYLAVLVCLVAVIRYIVRHGPFGGDTL